jgi:hypothetical protein
MRNAILVVVVGLLCALHNNTWAQASIHSAGGDGNGSGGSVSTSIGQVVYTSADNQSVRVIQGVQQPYEVLVVTGIKTNLAKQLKIKVYPNPTMDNLSISVDDLSNGPLEFQLFDLQGRLLDSRELSNSETIINLFYLPSATYLLKISSKRRPIQTFKIIKS